MFNLHNKRIVLGITGGIAAYKSVELTRLLRQYGADVRVVMTEGAKAFITPLTLQAISGKPIHDDLFDVAAEAAMGHIELARWADLILVAPATADFLANLAQGQANNLLTTICLATLAKIAIAPAMNEKMWHAAATQSNLNVLKERGVIQLGPAEGAQACGDVGLGRMLEPSDIVQHISALFETGLLAGKKVVVTAGPTQEAIDPIRYLSNYSSGKMGYALAEAAMEAGAIVTLISGPVHLVASQRVHLINVVTANNMLEAALSAAKESDIFISAAAVSDYSCPTIAKEKIKKTNQELTLILKRNADIVATVTKTYPKLFCIGFAAETENLIANAKQKLIEKDLDMIIANQIGDPKIGFGSDDNQVTILTKDKKIDLPLSSKNNIAREIVRVVASCHSERSEESQKCERDSSLRSE